MVRGTSYYLATIYTLGLHDLYCNSTSTFQEDYRQETGSVIMNKKYEIQCAVRGCSNKRGRKESVPIHRFPKRGDAGQRWIETCANSYLSRLEYCQVVERSLEVVEVFPPL